jgi:hypothetical protein
MSRPKVSSFPWKVTILAMLCTGLGFSQVLPGVVQTNRFSSVYTNLKTECRPAFKQKRGEENGQDMPLRCKGFGGYEIRIDYSAASSSLRVQTLGDKTGEAINLGMQPLAYDQTRKIEWRLANGKPFAVIYRVDKSKSDQPEEMWAPENKTGEALTVKGLKGHEDISFELDAKTPDANLKAREMADNAFAGKH